MMSKKDLLLELEVEDLPPLALKDISLTQKENISNILDKFGLSYSDIKFFCTPRRLVTLIEDLVTVHKSYSIVIGPPFNSTQEAKLKFAERLKVNVENLEIQEIKGGKYWVFKKIEEKRTEELLPNLVESIILSFKFAKNMRWDKRDFYFARPIRNYLLIWGEDIIEDLEILGIKGKNYTLGPQRYKPKKIKVESIDSYFQALKSFGPTDKEEYVILSVEERKDRIIEQIKRQGDYEVDFTPLDKVIFSVESPFVLLCSFPKEYLDLPQEIISEVLLSLDLFPLYLKNSLTSNFIYVTDTPKGVLNEVKHTVEESTKAKLQDAKFFWEQDLKLGLETLKAKTKEIVWDEVLGSLEDKVKRVMNLGIWVCKRLNLKEDIFIDACKYAKADASSLMVKEYPGLAGIAGYYYALHDNLVSKEAAVAIKEYYCKGGKIPSSKYGLVLALVDKLDTLLGLFSRGFIPSGSSDPYGLRKECSIIIKLLFYSDIFEELSLFELIEEAKKELRVEIPHLKLEDFIEGRYRTLLKEEGFSEEIIAVILSSKDNINFIQRSRKIKASIEEFRNYNKEKLTSVVTLSKRLKNILKNQEIHEFSEELLIEEEEKKLYSAYREVKLEAEKFFYKDKDFFKYLESLVKLTYVSELFFQKVYVMVEEEKIRKNRLALLDLIYKLASYIGDLSKIST